MEPRLVGVLEWVEVSEILGEIWMLVHKLDSPPKILLLLVCIHSVEVEGVGGLWVLSKVVEHLLHLVIGMLATCEMDCKLLLIEVASCALGNQLGSHNLVTNTACLHLNL